MTGVTGGRTQMHWQLRLACAGWLTVAAGVPAGPPTAVFAQQSQPLRIRVTPAVAQPPASVTVRADVEAHDDNRSLEVTAEADHFLASSRVPLEGRKGPRFTEIYFDNLPAGTYTVTAVLNGSMGPRARVTRTVLVGSPPDGLQ